MQAYFESLRFHFSLLLLGFSWSSTFKDEQFAPLDSKDRLWPGYRIRKYKLTRTLVGKGSPTTTKFMGTAATIILQHTVEGHEAIAQLLLSDNGSPKEHSPVYSVPVATQTITVEKLQPDTTYSIAVSFHNGISGQDSDKLLILKIH